MNQILICFFLTGVVAGQSYSITILGFHAADVNQTIHDSGRIEFTTQNRGLIDLIWPANNYYDTRFDPTKFSLISWRKKIRQGTYKPSLSARMDSTGVLVYNENHKVNLSKPAHTIFTMLAMIQSQGPETLDTKWFQYEHEGKVGKARFVWADSSKAWNGQDSILCDHYRLDINIIDSLTSVSKRTDYFMGQIILSEAVREVWVSRVKPKRIIAAKVKTPWFSLWAHIIETKEHW